MAPVLGIVSSPTIPANPSDRIENRHDDQSPGHKLYHRTILRFVCRFLASFNSIDLFAAEQSPVRQKEEEEKKPKWPVVVRYIYFYCAVKLTLFCILQYIYDFHSLRLEDLQNQNVTRVENQTSTRDEMLELEERISQDRSRLKLIGAPYMNLRILCVVAHVHINLFTFATYIQPQLFQRFVEPFNSGLMRLFVDRKRELAHCRLIARQEADRYLASSRLFVMRSADSKKLCSRHRMSLADRVELIRFCAEQKVRFLLDHTSAINTLNQFISSSKFRPLNRTDQWIDLISTVYVVVQVGLFVYIFGACYFLAFHLIYYEEWLGHLKIEDDFMDVVARGELVLMLMISVLSALFHATFFGFTTVDQIHYLLEFRTMIKDCILQTSKQIDSFSREAARNDGGYDKSVGTSRWALMVNANGDALNGKILGSFLHYKILVRQTRAIRNTCEFIAFVGIQVMMLMPILSILHVPFFKRRMIIVLVACTIWIITGLNLCLAPVCYMHCRGVDIYRSMSSLVASMSYLQQISRRKPGIRALHSHLIWSLTRELSSPERLVDQFTFDVLGTSLTYEKVMLAEFRCSLVLMFAMFLYYASNLLSSIGTADKASIFTSLLTIL